MDVGLPKFDSKMFRLASTASHMLVVASLALFGVVSSTFMLLQSGMPISLAASAPNILPYQGRILNSNSVPVSNASLAMRFRLFDALAAGTCLWSNDSTTCATDADETITLTDGLFSENLGGTGYAAIADTVFANNATVFLEVEIGGEVLSPRKQIGAAGYALNADTLDGLDSLDFASGWTDGGANVFLTTATDEVGIGTSTPTASFQIDTAGFGSFGGFPALLALTTPADEWGAVFQNETVGLGSIYGFFINSVGSFNLSDENGAGLMEWNDIQVATDSQISVSKAEDTQHFILVDSTNADSASIYVGDGTAGLDGTLSAQAGSLFLDEDGKLWVNVNGATDWTDLTAVGASTTTLQQAYDNDVDGSDVTVTMNVTDGDVVLAGDQDFRVTTTGNSIFDTTTLVVDATNNRVGIGDSTPEHVFDIEAGSLADDIEAFYVTATINSANANEGARFDFTSSGSGAISQTGVSIGMNAGYTGTQRLMALQVFNSAAGTGNNFRFDTSDSNPLGNSGFNAFATATTIGLNIGGYSEALGGNTNVGLVGKAITAKASATNIGVIGVGRNTNATSPIEIGGYFGLFDSTPTFDASAGLIASNGSTTNSIFLARDNNTTVFTISDGGTTTLAGNFLPSTNDTFNLGSDSQRWADIFLGPGTINIGTADADDYEISYDTTLNNLVFNEDSDNVDVRFEGNGNANLLFVDGANDRIGIGDATPTSTLDVTGSYGVSDTTVIDSSRRFFAADGAAGTGTLAYGFSSDTDTGLFHPAANTLGVAVNGAQVAQFHAGTANTPLLTMGTTTALGQITVNSLDASGVSVIVMQAYGTANAPFSGGQFAGVYSNGTAASPTAATSGNTLSHLLGVGRTSSSGFNYGGMIAIRATESYTSSASGGDIAFFTTATGANGVATLGSSQRAVITSGGNFGIGDATPASMLTVGNGDLFQVNSSGDLVKIDNVTYDWPDTQGGASTALVNDGSGNLSWSATGPSSAGGWTDDGTTVRLTTITDSVGIGTATPSATFEVAGSALQRSTGTMTVAGTVTTASIDAPIDIATSGTYGYVTGFTADSLTVFDLSIPGTPVELATVTSASFLNNAGAVAAAGSYVYVVESLSTEFTVVDVSDPNAPTVVGSKTLSISNLRDVAVAGNFAYVVASSSDALAVIDISNPTSPQQVGTVTDATNLDGAQGVAVYGSFAYVAAETADRLTIIDISDPEAPTVVGSVTNATTLDRATSVATNGAYAYVASLTSSRVTIVNVQDPTAPTISGNVTSVGGETASIGIALYGGYALVAGRDQDRILMVDVSVPATPVVLGSLTDGTNLNGVLSVAVIGTHAAVVGVNNNTLATINLSGLTVASLNAGSAMIDALSIRGSLHSSATASFDGGVNVGIGGFTSAGAASIAGPTGTIGLHIVQQTVDNPAADAITNQAFVIDVNEGVGADDVMIIRADADGTPNAIFRIDNNGAVTADGAFTGGGADFAEYFPNSDQTLVATEVVCLDVANPGMVLRCGEEQRILFGVVTTQPGFLANGAGRNVSEDPTYTAVGLLGQVPTRISSENGNISVGDPITASSTRPGYAKKATDAGRIIGYALEPYTEGSAPDNLILVFVNAGSYAGYGTNETIGTENTASTLSGNLTALNMSGNIFMQGNQILDVGKIVGLGGKWSIDENGTILTKGLLKTVIESYQGTLVETVAVTSPDVQITLVGSAELVNGEAVIVFEDVKPEYNDIIDTASPVRVVVTPNGPVSLYVTAKDHNGFTVREMGGTSSGVTFDWMVSAYRKDFAPVVSSVVEVPVEELTPEPLVVPPPFVKPVLEEVVPAEVPLPPEDISTVQEPAI